MKRLISNLAGRKLRSAWSLVRETFIEWDRDNTMQLAATLAFYMVFSFAPVLILIAAAASSVFGSEAARTEVINQLQGILGRSGAQMVQTVLQVPADQYNLIFVLVSLKLSNDVI